MDWPPSLTAERPENGVWDLVLVPGTLREMLIEPKKCPDRPKTRKVRATARKFYFMIYPAIVAHARNSRNG